MFSVAAAWRNKDVYCNMTKWHVDLRKSSLHSLKSANWWSLKGQTKMSYYKSLEVFLEGEKGRAVSDDLRSTVTCTSCTCTKATVNTRSRISKCMKNDVLLAPQARMTMQIAVDGATLLNCSIRQAEWHLQVAWRCAMKTIMYTTNAPLVSDTFRKREPMYIIQQGRDVIIHVSTRISRKTSSSINEFPR